MAGSYHIFESLVDMRSVLLLDKYYQVKRNVPEVENNESNDINLKVNKCILH